MVSARRRSRGSAGFTLLEMMVVVIMIGILAAIAVPAFTDESRKTKANSEVSAFFAEFQTREEQYRVDVGAYLAALTTCPASPSPSGQSITACVASGQPWGPNVGTNLPADQRLNVSLPSQTAFCTYKITTGSGTGTNNPNGFTFTSPTGIWYYLLATCDMDGDGTKSTFFVSSVDSTIQKLNEGE